MNLLMPMPVKSIIMPSKVLVVGAGGFIGRGISARLIDAGYEVYGASRTKPNLDYSGFTLGRSDTIENIEPGAYDSVVFSAGKLRPNSKVKSLINDVFPEAIEVIRFAELCESAGVKKFIMISSGGTIYGEGGGSKKVETDRLQPQSPYGYMHLLVDKGLSQIKARGKLQTVCMRVANVYGPGQNIVDGQGLIPAIRNCVIKGDAFGIRGDGTAVRDYIFIDDVAEAIRLVINAENVPLALNIGSSRGASINEVVSLFEKQINQMIKVTYNPAVGTEVKEIVLDNSLAREELGWAPQTSLELGLRKFIEKTPVEKKEVYND